MSSVSAIFSSQSACYSHHRPGYPSALFEWLATLPDKRELAWDVGTGNGQAAVELANFFNRVIATDASAEQIKQARPYPGIEYRVGAAEQSLCADASVDLVCVAQALHWFDLARFYAAVRRAAAGGIIAAITYGVHRVNPSVDAVLNRLRTDYIDAYWPPGREHVDDGYRSILFPFECIAAPHFDMSEIWPLDSYLGYLRTWSAVIRYSEVQGFDPVARLLPEFTAAWGDPHQLRRVTWDLSLRVGRVD